MKRPRGLNHVAYVTTDTAATKRFYTEILGMKLVGHAIDDSVGSTGEQTRFLHTFFEMGDGSCIAFFEIEGQLLDHHDSPLPRWAPHLALSVGSMDELNAAHQRLLGEGIKVRGVIDHEGTWKSIYFFDPNGVRLELTYQVRQLNDDDAAAATTAVAQWISEHTTSTS
ncbi:catechol 2,3-dioxygenase-like lactoylglutathione lyase family enzyme [Tamaricihabitans halophyticus]|uniref:Catechol 2,3-dioxygenase-like lactoylglutathione lyase family enzyme n=1 Tax=Tamaricihabitans halophyticus TaxID=1262583 RepID=A0A4R2Q4E6_9PSEU|nr:VOC family protein [Tamaricihabitans halophyticus]TCP43612.1 catechol 2,3-dioxygenase-like lactoylglutathione lyase family enzyme [Tamaricihabitans halophyticus]